MKTTLVILEGAQLQKLAWEFWQKIDFAAERSGIFYGVAKVLEELRFGQFGYEYEVSLTDQDAIVIFQKRIAAFTNLYGKEADEDLLRTFRLIPWQYGVTSQVFSWFVSEGEAGRNFFLERRCDPEGFIKQTDLDFAWKLSQLQEWNIVKKVYQNQNVDTD